MPKSRLLVLSVAIAIAVGVTALPRRAHAEGGPFGLGIMLGSPTGLSLKYYMSRETALDAGIGVAFYHGEGLHVHGDFLWHPFISPQDGFFLALYLGVGVRFLAHDHGRFNEGDAHLGVRVPFGILFDFKSVPIDVFLELALVFDFINDHDDFLDVNGAIGVRYYF